MDIQNLYEIFRKSGKVSTDTRKIEPGCIFFALKGERFDGNRFAEEALAQGAHWAVVDDPACATDNRYILVENVLKTLQALARFHRDQMTIPVIGLTGSNGKTTSKELVHAVLAKKFNTFATKGNLNNHIGVPLSILAITSPVELAVIEMGANRVGDIAELCAIANPTHGFITNIGKAHIGTFGGFNNIVRGKSELYMHLINHHGTVFINSQNPILFNMAKRFSNPVFYPQKGDYFHCELLNADPYVVVRTENGINVQTKLIGAYNFENIAVALCIGKFFGVEASLAAQAVADYEPANMRSQVVKQGTNTIILDAYNANPTSMAAAIENMVLIKADRKVLILGDMYELEEEAEREHRALGKLIRDFGFTDVLLCGSLMQAAAEEFSKAKHFSTKEELLNYLKQNPISNATVLVKASRGVGLEAVMDVI